MIERFASLVRFEHTIFALPYAYVGAILAVDGWPGLANLLWITVAMVGARSFAMAANRIVDAAIDARNPRTATRELPAGRLSRGQVVAFSGGALALFVVAVWQLDPACRPLAPIVIVAFVAYPYLKRITPLCHLGLGLIDGLAPVAGFIAVTGRAPLAAWLLGLAVACWIAGFDIIYATMDLAVDRAQGLHSMPADYGLPTALAVSKGLHALSVAALGAVGFDLHLGPLYAIGVVLVAGLLAYEQRLVSPTDLSRVNAAFFSVNGTIAMLYTGAVVLDVAVR